MNRSSLSLRNMTTFLHQLVQVVNEASNFVDDARTNVSCQEMLSGHESVRWKVLELPKCVLADPDTTKTIEGWIPSMTIAKPT